MSPSFIVWFGVSTLLHALLIFIIAIALPTAPSQPASSNNSSVLIVDFLSKKNNLNSTQLEESLAVNSKEIRANKVSNSIPPSSDVKNNEGLSLLPLAQEKYYRFKELDQAPNIIENIDQNPAELLSNKQGGSLTLQLKIDETGNVIQVEVLKSNLPHKFAKSATNVFMQKKFSPGLKGSVPVKSVLEIVINYSPITEITTEITNEQP